MSRLDLHQQKLRELATFEVTGQFEDSLNRLTCIAGELLAARRVSLMLLDIAPGKGACLKLAALYGELPEAAWKEEPAAGQGIAGQVLASGVSIRVASIGRSSWKQQARHGDEVGGFLACPVLLAGRPAGVLNVSQPIDRPRFSSADQANAELAALLIGRAIQVGRLDRMLDSRFAQMAFTLEGATDAVSVIALSAHDPDKVAKMLARGFYRELRHCGFTPNQVIHAAGEIISELTRSLNRHKKRIGG
ncbi:MAG: GAF domain-containing protein [Pseudomonadota bacterium]|nr:GAF domain-containing protein [Pseudomonadota bacterium]